MTEPGTGSDLAGVRTTAVRDGDEYVLNGAKTFITGGIQADLVDRGGPHVDRSRQPAARSDAAGRRGRYAGIQAWPRAGEDGLQGAGHRRTVVRRRPRSGGQSAGGGGRSLRLPRPQPAAGADDGGGRVGRPGPRGGDGDDRLRQGPQGVRDARRVVPEHQVRTGRMLGRGRGRPGDDRPCGGTTWSTASCPVPTRHG